MSSCSDLKVGDKVVLNARNGQYIRKVERLTKTQIVVSGTGNKFRRADGRRAGGDTWSYSSIKPATQEDIDRCELASVIQQKRSLVNQYFYKFNPNRVSEKSLDVLIEAIEKLNDVAREEGE